MTRYADMTDRQMRRDLLCGALVFVLAVFACIVWSQQHRLNAVRTEREAWKRTAQYWESSWARWAAQMDTLPPHGTAKPERGE